MFNILLKRKAFKLCVWLMAAVLAFPAISSSDCCCAQANNSSQVACPMCDHCSTDNQLEQQCCCTVNLSSDGEHSSSRTPCNCKCNLDSSLVLAEDVFSTTNIETREICSLRSLDELASLHPTCSLIKIDAHHHPASSLERCISLSCFTL